MKSLFLSTSDKNGGAAIAAYRLLEGLRQVPECNAEMFVGNKITTSYYVKSPEANYEKLEAIFGNPMEKLALLPYPKRDKVIFSSAIVPNYGVFEKISLLNVDIIHLHWINRGFLRLEQLLNINKPIVWTLHDMWAFTGGCHYSGKCNNYISHCGNCPVLNSGKQKDLAYSIFKRKQKILKSLNLTVVCPSTWLADCAKNSELLKNKKVLTIHNGLDIDLFKPVDKTTARNILNLPQNKKLILFGALNSLSDERKGFKYLYKALKNIEKEYSKNCELVIFGADCPEKPVETEFNTHYTGALKDEISMALLYSACDVMVTPSIEDNLPNTTLESICSGTPAVAFSIGGMPDMIDHKINGYLAKPYEPEDLAKGIKWVLSLNSGEFVQVSANARKKAEQNFDIRLISKKYYDLYEELLIG